MKKKIMILILAAAMTVSAAGCGEKQAANDEKDNVTFESLAEEVAEKEEDVTSVSTDMDVNVTLGMSTGEEGDGTLETAVHLTGTVDAFISPDIKTKGDMTMEMKMLGMTLPVKTQQYIVVEDGKCISYAQSDEQDDWTRTELDVNDNIIQSQSDLKVFKAVQEGKLTGTLEDAVEKVENKDCYVVNVQVTGDYVGNIISQAIGELAGGGDVDWSKYATTVKYYIDVNEKLPVKMSADMAEMVAGAFEETDMGAEVQVPDCTVDITFSNYNNVEDFQIPEEAKNAENTGE